MNAEDIRKIVFEVLNEAGLAVDGKAVADEIKKEIAEEKLDRVEDQAEMKAAEAILKGEVVDEAACETKDEAADEAVCEPEKKDEAKDEVIKAEVLNQKPTIGMAAGADACKWRGTKGQDLIKYLDRGAYRNDL